ncbi:hypothetical protein PQQ52_18900 [Paraburkholderia sediminicola]|uniref:hypothetical protein n=1 Tax=Paraburkholderia sediminicola TaxID=458836 RepID=UPI0038B75A0A
MALKRGLFFVLARHHSAHDATNCFVQPSTAKQALCGLPAGECVLIDMRQFFRRGFSLIAQNKIVVPG